MAEKREMILKNSLENFIFFLSKSNYTRAEVFIILIAIVFLVICYTSVIDVFCYMDKTIKEPILYKIYYNWIFFTATLLIIYYAKMLNNEELIKLSTQIEVIDHSLKSIKE